MGKLLNKYKKIIGEAKVREIENKARPLRGKHVLHVNATYYGGGVAEILDNLVVLMNDVGINACWSVIKGNQPFFEITKLFHNGTQGQPVKLTQKIKDVYEGLCARNSVFMNFSDIDAVIAHDPQVLPLIKYARPNKKKEPWIWRAHTDIAKPDKALWTYLKKYIRLYDEMVVSDEKYLKSDVRLKQSVIMPSIDPLNDKNKDISMSEAKRILSSKLGIKFNKPIIAQVSRYDQWKDQCGVLDVFTKIRKEIDCQLILMGNYAVDDPEGAGYYEKTLKKSKGMKDVRVLADKENDSLLVNALQKASDVILQKSLKEGFGLTVSEALWKGTPVVASNVGGIVNQIVHGKNGYLVNNIRECAERTIEILKDEKLKKRMGKEGRAYVREHFLITRHLADYLDLLNRVIK